jgi:hypothetical protein
MSSFSGPEIRNDNLVLHLDAGNVKSYNYNEVSSNEDFSSADYERSAGLTVLKGFLAPDGSYNASRVRDQLAGSTEYFTRYFIIPNDSQYYELILYIKKTTGGTSPTTGFNINFLLGSSTFGYQVRLNTDTGTYEAGCTTIVSSADNDYWKLSCFFPNNSTGNTLLQITYYPARNVYGGGFPDVVTVTGSQIIWGMQLIYPRNGQLGILPYKPNYSIVGSASRTITPKTWTNLIGTENNGNFVNYASPNYSNGVLVFNGTDQYASITKPNPNITGLISIELWINFASAAGNVPIMKGSHFALNISSSTWQWADSSNYSFANFIQRTVSGLYTVGQWTHLVITKDASFNVNLYKNGQLIDSRAAFGGNLTAVTSTTWLGGYSDTDTAPASARFSGSLSVAKVYNAALSAEQVLQNFNALRGRYGV